MMVQWTMLHLHYMLIQTDLELDQFQLQIDPHHYPYQLSITLITTRILRLIFSQQRHVLNSNSLTPEVSQI